MDTYGNGALMTREECMLDRVTQARNPTLNRRQIERTLHDFLGTSEVVCLNGSKEMTPMATLTTSAIHH